MGQEGFAVFEQAFLCLFAEGDKKGTKCLLTFFSSGDFFFADGGVFLGAGGEVLESALVVEPGEAFGAGLEVQAQRTLDSDLVITEVLVVENLADDALALDRLVGDRVFLGEGARLAVAEVAEDFGEFADVVGVFLLVGGVADAAAFVAEAFLHLHPERAGINELHLALAG